MLEGKIEGRFNVVLSGFQSYLKEIQSAFEGGFKGVSRNFQGYIMGISTKGKKLQGCLKKVSSLLLRNLKKKVQRCFKNVSMNFFFIIAWHSSQLPDQKEDFFYIRNYLIRMKYEMK